MMQTYIMWKNGLFICQWVLCFFGGFAGLYYLGEGEFWESEFWESPIFFGGSLAASLTIPYFILNINEKFNFPKSILTDSEKEIYKQTYSKKLRQRKFRYAAVSTTVSVVIVAVAVASFELDMSGGFGGGGNWGMGGYSGP